MLRKKSARLFRTTFTLASFSAMPLLMPAISASAAFSSAAKSSVSPDGLKRDSKASTSRRRTSG